MNFEQKRADDRQEHRVPHSEPAPLPGYSRVRFVWLQADDESGRHGSARSCSSSSTPSLQASPAGSVKDLYACEGPAVMDPSGDDCNAADLDDVQGDWDGSPERCDGQEHQACDVVPAPLPGYMRAHFVWSQ